LKAAQMLEKAKESANSIRDSVLKLREEKKLLIARIKALIDTQSNFLELNVQNIDTHPKKNKIVMEPVVQEDQSEINVDDILEKLL
jgi:cell division initiation protein